MIEGFTGYLLRRHQTTAGLGIKCAEASDDERGDWSSMTEATAPVISISSFRNCRYGFC
jgi:hypothetical protein